MSIEPVRLRLVDEDKVNTTFRNRRLNASNGVLDAEWNDDALTLHGALQMLGYNVKELSDSLGIKPDKVRIVSAYIGGGVPTSTIHPATQPAPTG